MHLLCRTSLVLLAALCLLLAVGASVMAAPLVNSVTFSSLQCGNSSLTSCILNPSSVLSAYFSPGTPVGAVSVSVTQAASLPKLVTSHIYASDLWANIGNDGQITINGHEFAFTTCDTVANVVQAINNASIGIIATFDGVSHKVILQSTSGLGSFTYAETADILNGGSAPATYSGTDARAIATYSDGSTENYTSGTGFQLIGDIRAGLINLSVAGGSAVANLGHCIDIVSHGSVACASYLTSVIVDRVDVASASFAPGTPEGSVAINVVQPALMAKLTTAHVHLSSTSCAANGGTITINGHAFSVTPADTVADVVSRINGNNCGVTAVHNSTTHRVVLTDYSGYGSNHSFTYAETADILNGGAPNNATIYGCDAAAVVTYSNGFPEGYISGKGLQLIGSVRGGVINMTEAGNAIANHICALNIIPAKLIGCGDAVTVTLDLCPLYPISAIASPTTGLLVQTSASTWTGTFCAASTVGDHGVTFTVMDSSGTSTLTATYKTVQCFGTGIGSAYHPLTESAAQCYLYTVWGKVTATGSNSLCLTDGSGQLLKVVGAGDGYGEGDYLIVRGQLDLGPSPHVIVAHSVRKL